MLWERKTPYDRGRAIKERMASTHVSLFRDPVYGSGFNPDTEGYSHNMTVVILHCQMVFLDSLHRQWKANISLEGN